MDQEKTEENLPNEGAEEISEWDREKIKVHAAFKEHAKKNNGRVLIVRGAYGDLPGYYGLGEQIIKPPTGGTFIKLFGCSYLYKGFTFDPWLENLGLAKSLTSLLPRELIFNDNVTLFETALDYVFRRKTFYHKLNIYSLTFKNNIVNKCHITENEFNVFAKEIKRAVQIALNLSVAKYPQARELYEAISNLTSFVLLFLEYDDAYRYRVQDGLDILVKLLNLPNNDFSIDDPAKVINKVLEVMIKRENPLAGVSFKWQPIKKAVVPAIRYNKHLKFFLSEFFKAVDFGRVVMDDADKYFSLARAGYNFRGEDIVNRLTQKAEIDRQRRHVFIELQEKDQPAAA